MDAAYANGGGLPGPGMRGGRGGGPGMRGRGGPRPLIPPARPLMDASSPRGGIM